PDYIPGLKEPQTPPAPQDEDEHEPMFIQLHDPDFMPELIYPEYIPLEDEHILPAEEQPLPPFVSPTAESPGYVAESDPKEDPEEYEEDEAKDGPVYYPMDGGDDGEDDDDGDSSGYDADDEDEDEEEEEEEHLAPADSAVVAMPTPPPSPLTSLSPPSAGERLARCMAPAVLPSPLLPLSSYPPPPVDRRDGIPESEQPPRKRMTLQETVWIVEDEAYAAREAWAQSVGLSQTVHHELQTLREQNPPPPNTNTPPHYMTPESVQAMIDQALLRNSTNGYGSQSSHEDNPRHVQTTRPCFYVDFMKCHPLNLKGNEGVGELKKLEIELWNLKVKGNDVSTYINRFQELTLICTKFVANENEKIDKYTSGLPDNIYGNVYVVGNAEKNGNAPVNPDSNVIT
nr:reverse transcriptase domain-containing protein [Tanacetum cinerariifolium]